MYDICLQTEVGVFQGVAFLSEAACQVNLCPLRQGWRACTQITRA